MFFLWFAKNKYFNKRHSLSGQIMPFLLVIIAIFLGAFFTTYQIGSNAINMTCVDNAADACALAAASHMAMALNLIHKDMGTLWKTGQQRYQQDLKKFYNVVNINLTQAQKAIIQAQRAFEKAVVFANAAANSPDCTYWGDASAASIELNVAWSQAQMASQKIMLAIRSTKDMEKLVNDFQKGRAQGLCILTDRTDNLYNTAKSDGVLYALENNCVFMNSLSSGQQNEVLNQVNGIPNNAKQPNAGASYSWKDGLGNSRSMSANVTMPKVASYELEVTDRNIPPCTPVLSDPLASGSDPYGIGASMLMSEMLKIIYQKFTSYSSEELSIYEKSQELTKACGDSNPTVSIPARLAFGALRERARKVASELSVFRTDFGIIVPAIKTLIQHNKNILKWMSPKAGSKRIVSSKDCNVGNMIVLAVVDVKFESGCITCRTNIDGNSGISASSFNKDGQASTGATGTKNYIPGIQTNDGSCSDNGNASIGKVDPKGQGDNYNQKDKAACPSG